MGFPSKRISPLRDELTPHMDMRVVDLPAPLAPMSVTISPSSTLRKRPQSLNLAVKGVDTIKLKHRGFLQDRP